MNNFTLNIVELHLVIDILVFISICLAGLSFKATDRTVAITSKFVAFNASCDGP